MTRKLLFFAGAIALCGNYAVADIVIKNTPTLDELKPELWSVRMYTHADANDTAKSHGFVANNYGISTGADFSMFGDFRMGFGYSYTFANVNGTVQSTNVNNIAILTYAKYESDKFEIQSDVYLGISSYLQNGIVTSTPANADYDAYNIYVKTNADYRFESNRTGITPSLELRYVTIGKTSFMDSLNNVFDRTTSDLFSGTGMVRIDSKLKISEKWKFLPDAKFGITYDFISSNHDAVITLENGGVYAIPGTVFERLGGMAYLGWGFEYNNTTLLSLTYQSDFRKSYINQTFMLNFDYRF